MKAPIFGIGKCLSSVTASGGIAKAVVTAMHRGVTRLPKDNSFKIV